MFGAPTKSKKAIDMQNSFREVFKQMGDGILPQRIFTDRGLEFESAEMHKFFHELGIQKLSAKNSKIKAGVAERAIRTLKTRCFSYQFHHHNEHHNISGSINILAKKTPPIGCRFYPNSCMPSTIPLAVQLVLHQPQLTNIIGPSFGVDSMGTQ